MLSFRKNRGKLLLCAVYLIILGVAVYETLSSEPYFYPIHSLHNIQGNVICGYPGYFTKYGKVPFREGMSVFSYLYQNPEMSIRLFLSRFYKVFSMSRPYFSPKHNLLLFSTTFIYYLLALIGVVGVIRQKEKKFYFPIAGILVFSFPMVIFCVEWTGRFSLPVIFYVLLLSCIGIGQIRRYPSSSIPAQDDGAQS